MDIVEQIAADIAMKMNGGEWTDGKWYSQGHRDAWVKTVRPYADEIMRLREENNNLKSALRNVLFAENSHVKVTDFTKEKE